MCFQHPTGETLSYNNLFEIALHTPFDQLISLCRIDKQFSALCHDDHFWQEKTRYDFPNIIPISVTNNIDRYLSAKYINLLNKGDPRDYRNLQMKLEQAVKTNNMRWVLILTPIALKYHGTLNKETFTLEPYVLELCEKTIGSHNFVILTYLIEKLKQITTPEYFYMLIDVLIDTSIYESDLDMIKYIIEYIKRSDPTFKVPYSAYKTAVKLKNPDIQDYIAQHIKVSTLDN